MRRYAKTFWLAAGVALSLPHNSATAQATTLVLPITRLDERLDAVLALTSEADAILSARGIAHVPYGDAARDFEARHSKEPATWTQNDVDLLASSARSALEAIVSGNYQEALARTREARQRADGALEVINRRLKWSRQAFDTCALEVRGRYEEGDRPAAFASAVRCRTLYPGFEPDSTVHPHAVRSIFLDAAKEIARTQTRSLIVESSPPGCTVYLNGRSLGTTPYRQNELAAHEPRLQVECEQNEGHGRVHIVPAGTSLATISVDTIYERAVRTDGELLRLVYNDPMDPNVRAHALMTAKAVGAQRVLLITSPQPGRLSLTQLDEQGGQSVDLPAEHSAEELGATISTLFAASQTKRRTNPTKASVEGEPPQPSSPASEAPRRALFLALGGTALAGAAATSISGWALFAHRRDVGLRFRQTPVSDPEYLELQSQWRDGRRSLYPLQASAAVLGTTAGILFERALAKPPAKWLTIGLATAGAAIAAGSVGAMVAGGRCNQPANDDLRLCVRGEHRFDRGGFLLLNAVPLLLVPATWWLRRLGNSRHPLVIDAAVSSTSVGLSLRSTL